MCVRDVRMVMIDVVCLCGRMTVCGVMSCAS